MEVFFEAATGTTAGRVRKVISCLGKVEITERQAEKLELKKNSRLSPLLEKCCLRLVANESFENAEKDIEIMTGMKVSHSSQQRLVQRYEFAETEAKETVDSLSIDGGKVSLRTDLGEQSEWRDYQAIMLHGQVGAGFFQANQELIDWANSQPLAEVITCLGDGHDGIGNILAKIGKSESKREVLDWYHLKENLSKIGGSNARIKQVENYLWSGKIELALAKFEGLEGKEVKNLSAYLNKHRQRIPNYKLYQELGICIGSGGVESTIKRIGLRMKISGAQWKAENVPQYLKLRCAYLNQKIA